MKFFQMTSLAFGAFVMDNKICRNFQNYFGDAWNVFDFIIVLGSFIDIIYSEVTHKGAKVKITKTKI